MNPVRSFTLIPVLLLVALSAWSVAPAQEARLEPGMVNPGWVEPPPWFHESFLDIREDVQEATDAGRRLMLYFYQDGCPYCEKLVRDNFGQRDIADLTRRHFNVIAINMWGDREVTDMAGHDTTEKDFARDLNVQFTPTLLMFNEEFQVVGRINGYFEPHRFRAALSWIGERREDDISFQAYFEQLSPEPATGVLHARDGWLQPPHDLAAALKEDDRPLLVLFEQTQCSACDELHLDILARPDSEALLARFQVAQIDVAGRDRVITPEGEQTSAAAWARDSGVLYTPTLAFHTAEDGEVIRAEGYLRTFHVQSLMEYVLTGAYRDEPELQRYLDRRAQSLYEQGIEVDLMD